MDDRSEQMEPGTGLPSQQAQNRLAFLRYLPRRIADFERRIVRYRFAGWDPKGMVVLAGDAHRLADASRNYGLDTTRHSLLELAQMVGRHATELRGPDPSQTDRMFALLAAVLRSLPTTTANTAILDAEQAIPAAAMASPVATVLAADASPAVPMAGAVAAQPSADASATSASAVVKPAAGVDDPSPSLPSSAPTAIDAATASTPSPTLAVTPPITPPSNLDAGDASPSPPNASPDGDDAIATTSPGGDDDTDITAMLAPSHDAREVTPTTARETADEAVEASIDEAEEADVPADSGMRRIFLLGDDEAFSAALARQLERDGYAVEVIADVDELSEMLTCMVPNMLLVDASQVSRLAIIGALRRDAQQNALPPRHIQLVALAAHDDIEIRRAAHRAGVDLLLLPPHDAAAIAARLQALHVAAGAEPVRVLVVDDQRADALFAKGVLSRAGMHVRIEHDPMQVVPALANERADLILMDLHMPFANGVEVTMLLRADARFARIPIVFLSGESDPDSRLEAINAGGDEFLFKPIRPRHLVAAVQDRVRRLHAIERSCANESLAAN